MTMAKKESGMLTGVIWKEMLLFFLPIAAGTLFQQLYNAVDAIIVGKFVGTEALAAVGGSPAVIVNLMVSIFVSLTTGASVIIAQLYGAGNESELQRATGTAMSFFALLGIGIALICEPLTGFMLRILKTPEETMKDAADYLYIYFAAFPILLLLNAQSGILRAVGDSRSPFIYMLIGCVTNICLDLLFVIRFRMGVKGVAWATDLSMLVNMALTTQKLMRTKESYRLDLHYLKPKKHLVINMMSIGIPSALSGAMYGVSNAILQASVNALGTQYVAAWALCGKIDGVYWATSSAAGSAITTFAGQNFGAGKTDRVKRSCPVSFSVFEPLTVFICSLVLIFGKSLLPLFTDDPTLIDLTVLVLWYFVPFYFIWTAIEILSGIMRGCGVVRVPVLINAICVCLFRVIWVLTVCRVNLTLFNVSICYAISWSICCVCMALYFRKWRKTL